MEQLNTSIIYILAGIGLITLIDAAGSILSRKFDFNYGYMTLFSFLTYTSIAYLISEKTGSTLTTMIAVMLMGFYDGTVGSKISEKLKANHRLSKEIIERITVAQSIFAGVTFSIVCGWIGIFLVGRLN